MRYCESCKNHPFEVQTRRYDPLTIIDIISKYFKIDTKLIMSKSRKRNIVEARHIISHVLYHDRFLKLSLNQVATLLNKKDHTTIIHSVNFCKTQNEIDVKYNQLLKDVYYTVYQTLEYFKN
jgi:chromosomal replication initiator protein